MPALFQKSKKKLNEPSTNEKVHILRIVINNKFETSDILIFLILNYNNKFHYKILHSTLLGQLSFFLYIRITIKALLRVVGFTHISLRSE